MLFGGLAAAANPDKSEFLQSTMPYFESYPGRSVDARVNDLMEDSDGYIWAATENGIMRFDGIYSHSFFSVDTLNLLKENSVLSLCDDTLQNKIWGAYAMKPILLKLDKKTYEQKIVEYHFNDSTLEQQSICFRNIYNFNDSLLLGSTSYGLCFINKKTEIVEPLFRRSSEEYRNYNNLFQIISTKTKTFFVNSGKLCYINSELDPDKFSLEELPIDTRDLVRHIDEKNDSTLILDCWDTRSVCFNLYEYNLKTHQLTPLVQTYRASQGIACSADGVWICTTSGLIFYDFAHKTLRTFTTANSLLPDNKLTCALKSRNQPIVWFGSYDGLIKNDYFSSKFSVTDLRRFSDSESSNMIAVHKDKFGGVWAWFIDGLFYRDPGSTYFAASPVSAQLGHLAVLSIAEDTTRNLIYFMTNNTFLRYNLVTHKWKQLNNDEQHVSRFLVLGNGKVVGTTRENYLFRYNPDTDEHEYQPKSYQSPKMTAFANDGDTVIWAGDVQGNLYSFNIERMELTFEAKIANNGRKVDVLRFCHRNGEKEMWISVNRSGLYYYQPRYKKVNRINYDKQLQSQIMSVEIDPKKNVWVATQLGIVCINNTNGVIYSYSKDNYSLCPVFNYNASSVDANGDVIMGGVNYFVEFNSDNFSENQYFPRPKIVSYRFSNSTTRFYDTYTNHEYFDTQDTIFVPKGIRSVQLFCRVLNFSKSRNNMLQWRMPDYSKKWETVSSTSPLSFPALSEGGHELQLRSIGYNGMPMDEVTSIIIYKSVYLYETLWFKVLCALLGISLIFFYIRMKVLSVRKQRAFLMQEVERQAGAIMMANNSLSRHKEMIEVKNAELRQYSEKLENMVEERTAELAVACRKAEESDKLKSAFLANLSHEVRTPMNCIVGFARLLGDPSNTPEEEQEFVHLIQESSNSLLMLLGDLLDVSRIETGQLRINLGDFNLYQELQDVFKLLQLERKATTYDFVLEADERLDGRTLYSDKDRFRQIIINLVYNAFKFTEVGEVRIVARLSDAEGIRLMDYPQTLPPMPRGDLLYMAVKDTGIGIPVDKLDVIFEPFRKLSNNKTLYPGLGLGLNIVKSLTEVLGGHVWVTSKVDIGTTFHLCFPFKKKEDDKKVD